MSATQLQLRRGDSATINASVPAVGEPWVMLDRDNLLVIGDGNEFGGIPVNPLPLNFYSPGSYISRDTAIPETRMNFDAGSFRSIKNDGDIRAPIAIKKDINAVWQEGDQVGGFPSTLTGGNPSPNTTYHAFSIGKIRNGTGDIDAGFDSDIDAVNLQNDASAYSYVRRRGSFLTDGSSQIRPFSQRGNLFLINPVEVINTTTPPSTQSTLSFVGVVPTGIAVRPLMSVRFENTTGSRRRCSIYFQEKGGATVEHLLFDPMIRETDAITDLIDWIRTDTGATMDWRVVIDVAAAANRVIINCHGWIDDELGAL